MSVFPPEVNPNQLAAFLRSVHTSNGAVHVHKLATDLGWDLTKLLPVIDAAKLLGLVKIENGEAELLEEGQRIINVKKGKVLELRNSLLQIEPFRTTLKFQKKFTGKDVAKELYRKGIRWHHEEEVNSMIVNKMLMQWAVRAGILDYDGYSFTPHIACASSA